MLKFNFECNRLSLSLYDTSDIFNKDLIIDYAKLLINPNKHNKLLAETIDTYPINYQLNILLLHDKITHVLHSNPIAIFTAGDGPAKYHKKYHKKFIKYLSAVDDIEDEDLSSMKSQANIETNIGLFNTDVCFYELYLLCSIFGNVNAENINIHINMPKADDYIRLTYDTRFNHHAAKNIIIPHMISETSNHQLDVWYYLTSLRYLLLLEFLSVIFPNKKIGIIIYKIGFNFDNELHYFIMLDYDYHAVNRALLYALRSIKSGGLIYDFHAKIKDGSKPGKKSGIIAHLYKTGKIDADYLMGLYHKLAKNDVLDQDLYCKLNELMLKQVKIF